MIAWLVFLSAAIGYGLARAVDARRAAKWKPREAQACVKNGERLERFSYRAQDAEGFLDERDALQRENAQLREQLRAYRIDEIEKRDSRRLQFVKAAS